MVLFESKINSLKRIGKGKVRDIYAVGNDKMLIVTSDRLSAFDVVLPDPIPDKGAVLNSTVSSIGKAAIMRAWQAEMFAQHGPFVVAAKQAAAL